MIKLGKKKVIGRQEIVDFPNLGLLNIPAKIDTGAFTSSIHCEDVSEIDIDGERFVKFTLLDPEQTQYHKKEFVLPIHNEKLIKNSFGMVEQRFVISTFIRLFEEDIHLEITLADRSLMEYPVLLGRKLLKKKYIVDVSRTNQSLKERLKIA